MKSALFSPAQTSWVCPSKVGCIEYALCNKGRVEKEKCVCLYQRRPSQPRERVHVGCGPPLSNIDQHLFRPITCSCYFATMLKRLLEAKINLWDKSWLRIWAKHINQTKTKWKAVGFFKFHDHDLNACGGIILEKVDKHMASNDLHHLVIEWPMCLIPAYSWSLLSSAFLTSLYDGSLACCQWR